MGIQALLVLAVLGCAAAAPWRCYRTCDGATVCFGEVGQPRINPPTISLNRPSPPCTGPATVYTPACPSPCPSPAPCPQPCDPCNPCPCNPCNPCLY